MKLKWKFLLLMAILTAIFAFLSVSNVSNILIENVIIMLMFSLSIFILVYLLFLKKIENLNHKLNQMNLKKNPQPLEMKGKDEVNSIIGHINSMIATIRELNNEKNNLLTQKKEKIYANERSEA